jgi:glucosyl-3-phosphoglycerate synthase
MAAMTAQEWATERTLHHSRYPAERIAEERTESVSACVPTKECAATVGGIVGELVALREVGVLDEVVVVDADSRDGTARLAEEAGATVYKEADLLPRYGPPEGKGDAMWRALSVMRGDVVCYVDGDSEGFEGHFATGLIGPLLCAGEGGAEAGEEREVQFVKAFYRRPFEHGGVELPEGGGRVNHLTARPALELFYPALAAVRQPLAGEVAARRDLLERLPFATGYGVEIAMLIDAWKEVGLEGMAQVDLDVHRNPHQPLRALTPMAYAVLATIARRLEREGRLGGVAGGAAIAPGAGGSPAASGSEAPAERPPMASVRVT